MSAVKRPYVRFTIEQLESLFNERARTAAELRSLKDELSFRNTPRALHLRKTVEQALSEQNSDGIAGRTASTRKPRMQAPAPHGDRGILSSARDRSRQAVSEKAKQGRDEVKTWNEAPSILGTWVALEALSPALLQDADLRDRRKAAHLKPDALPWTSGEKSKPSFKLFYRVILGTVRMDAAMEALIRAFGEDEERFRAVRRKAAMAEVLVDSRGVPLAENGTAVSSFPWALRKALDLQFGDLASWPSVEEELRDGLLHIVRRADEDGKWLPLDMPTIDRAYRWLHQRCGVAEAMIEEPVYALRHYHPFRSRTPPEPSLLNSFFLHDLANTSRTLQAGTAPENVLRYLGSKRFEQRVDVLEDHSTLEAAVSPELFPAAKWPAGEGRSLVMLQQAAVNLCAKQLKGQEGILSVNGPPGTGKTTLLRDIVAMCVGERAAALCTFQKPEDVFRKTGERVEVGNSRYEIFELDPAVKGHEVLVASSNNKAVENVSKELPELRSVHAPERSRYFKSISDAVHAGRKADRDDEGSIPEPIKTWGLIAAVLGNKANRSSFWNTFWWDDDRSIKTYLKAVRGDTVLITHTDPETGVVEQRTPEVVTLEQPPAPAQAKENWRGVRERFLTLKAEIDSDLHHLEEVRRLCLAMQEPQNQLRMKQAERERLDVEVASAKEDIARLKAQESHVSNRLSSAMLAWNRHKTSRPSLFARLRRTDEAKAWADEDKVWRGPVDVATNELATVQGSHKRSERQHALLTAKLKVLESEIEAEEGDLRSRQDVIEAHRARLGGRLVDDAKFAEGHASWNISTPWITDALNTKREELFFRSLDVHRAFIDATADRIFHNLAALQVCGTAVQKSEERRKLLGDLWSTLFLVVPVLSTTFASVDSMFGELPPRTLGWLLIDEGGQATPQAAVGAILRSKRIVVVGDPLQIPPVVSLPERLNQGICELMKVDEIDWTAPSASTQTLADRASPYQSQINRSSGGRPVGLPLLVHRRCQDPMFSIANKIAYGGQMVQVVGPRAMRVQEVLGKSQWFDIETNPDTKWSSEEGARVLNLLRELSVLTQPDVFVISPFRVVADEMRHLLSRQTDLLRSMTQDPNGWLNDRVGTIHTFQGREAETVILVLGAPSASQQGARQWAAGTPNILNVAASRAKHQLYVVGSRKAWEAVGHASVLGKELA